MFSLSNILRGIATAVVLGLAFALFTNDGETPNTPEKPTTPEKPMTYVTIGDTPACLTEAALDEAIKAFAAKDEEWFKSLGDVCILTKAGLKVRHTDPGILISQVRIFTDDGDSMLVWISNYGVVQSSD